MFPMPSDPGQEHLGHRRRLGRAGRTRPRPDQPQPRRAAALAGGRPARASGRESFSVARGRRGADGAAVAPVRR